MSLEPHAWHYLGKPQHLGRQGAASSERKHETDNILAHTVQVFANKSAADVASLDCVKFQTNFTAHLAFGFCDS